ncbi:hypothetical protein ACFOZ0_15820 [Streptomyces yaanensis]|uniref:Uncharacterized protein n=1 Tax=Streptomyces yaanensis TaxID=1142239 RepID=A0ABV7SEE9_9ACTN|nr:hypothetical protein [Streptomyces sp. CGMCC 4.7035]WNB98465.1 hypothetical protein Q2K21_10480 [Streptomyces sp. CGMCC 4.7035]
MNDRVTPPIHALPDGEAELALVIHLPWEDVARLGQEAARLASQMQRPVTLDEAVSHRLRSARAAAAHAKPAGMPPQAAAVTSSASVSSLPPRPPAEQARQAIERINGVGQHETA